MATKQAIRRAVGKELKTAWFGQSQQASTQQLDDTNLVIPGARAFTKGYLYLPSVPQTSRVTLQTATSVTFSPAYTGGVSTGLSYELWKSWNPSDVNDRINAMLTTEATYFDEDYLEMEGGVWTGLAVPTLANRLVAVDQMRSDDTYIRLTNWETKGTPNALSLDLEDFSALQVGYVAATLRLTYERNFDALDTETQETTCYFPWLVDKVCAEMWRLLLTRTMSASRQQQWEMVQFYNARAQTYGQKMPMPSAGSRVGMGWKVTP